MTRRAYEKPLYIFQKYGGKLEGKRIKNSSVAIVYTVLKFVLSWEKSIYKLVSLLIENWNHIGREHIYVVEDISQSGQYTSDSTYQAHQLETTSTKFIVTWHRF